MEGEEPQSSVLGRIQEMREDIREWFILGKYTSFLLCLLGKSVSLRERIMFFFVVHWASIVLNSLNKNKVPIKYWIDELKYSWGENMCTHLKDSLVDHLLCTHLRVIRIDKLWPVFTCICCFRLISSFTYVLNLEGYTKS